MNEPQTGVSWKMAILFVFLFNICVMVTIAGAIGYQAYVENKNRPPDQRIIMLDKKLVEATGTLDDFRKGRLGEKKSRLIARNDPETALIARLKAVEHGAPAEIEQ